MNLIFYSISTLALQDDNKEKAYMLVEKQSKLANLFEMGKYHEVSCMLNLAIAEKDTDGTIEAAKEMLTLVDNMCAFTGSPLYEHMAFKEPSAEFIADMRKNLLTFAHKLK